MNIQRGNSALTSISLELSIRMDARLLTAVSTAMIPEALRRNEKTQKNLSCRFLVDIGNGRELRLIFHATEPVSLRASMNSDLRLVHAALKMIKRTSEAEVSPRSASLEDGRERPKKVGRQIGNPEGT